MFGGIFNVLYVFNSGFTTCITKLNKINVVLNLSSFYLYFFFTISYSYLYVIFKEIEIKMYSDRSDSLDFYVFKRT